MMGSLSKVPETISVYAVKGNTKDICITDNWATQAVAALLCFMAVGFFLDWEF